MYLSQTPWTRGWNVTYIIWPSDTKPGFLKPGGAQGLSVKEDSFRFMLGQCSAGAMPVSYQRLSRLCQCWHLFLAELCTSVCLKQWCSCPHPWQLGCENGVRLTLACDCLCMCLLFCLQGFLSVCYDSTIRTCIQLKMEPRSILIATTATADLHVARFPVPGPAQTLVFVCVLKMLLWPAVKAAGLKCRQGWKSRVSTGALEVLILSQAGRIQAHPTQNAAATCYLQRRLASVFPPLVQAGGLRHWGESRSWGLKLFLSLDCFGFLLSD